MNDWTLLQAYVNEGNQAAFTELVNRHIHLVFSAALRQVRGAHDAEEVTQAVFLLLAHKAPGLRPCLLAPWLLRSTFYTAANARRANRRREHMESAASMDMSHQESDAAWEQISSMLDDALMSLTEKDREAVVLRYMQRRSYKEMAGEIGLSDDTVQKRVSRAVEKLRTYFADRGVVLPAAVFVTAISARAMQAAPVHLAGSVAAGVFQSVASGVLPMLVQVTVNSARWFRLQRMLLWGAASALLVGGGLFFSNDQSLSSKGGGAKPVKESNAPNLHALPFEHRAAANRVGMGQVTFGPGKSHPETIVPAGTQSNASQGSVALRMQNVPIEVVLEFYRALVACELVITPEAQQLAMGVTIQPEQDSIAADAAARLIEAELGRQCGLTFTRMDQKRISIGRVTPSEQQPRTVVTPVEVPVEVRALDAITEEPITQFSVYVTENNRAPRSLGNGAGGIFRSTNVFGSNAQCVLNIRAEGYLPATARTNIIGGSILTAELRLSLKGSRVTGRVISPEGLPIKGAKVFIAGKDFGPFCSSREEPSGDFLFSRDRDRDKQTTTNAEGLFALDRLPDSEYVIITHESGCSAVRLEALVLNPVKLNAWGRIEGWLQLTWDPIGSQTVSARVESSPGPQVPYHVNVTTDDNGHFLFSKVPPGHYRISRMVSVSGGVRAPSHTIKSSVAGSQTTQVLLDDTAAVSPSPPAALGER
jgi:RNA polymerase sigma factor (sigma-70 family)